MPRYPNVWFYVDSALADSYGAAVRLVADQLRGPMRLLEDHGPFAQSGRLRLRSAAGASAAVGERRTSAAATRACVSHAVLPLRSRETEAGAGVAQNGRAAIGVSTASRASAHYEVEHTNPNHADVEICPVCGRTGEYETLKGNLVEMVHDPLGVELLLNGTIRNQPVTFEDDRREVGGIGSMQGRFAVQQQVFAAASGDRNTLRIGVVVLAPLR